MRLALALAAALFLAEPASASTCDERGIAAMSNQAAADAIWAGADLIGYGYVATVETVREQRQSVDMLMTFKGAADRRFDLHVPPGGWAGLRSSGFSPYFILAGREETAFLMLSRTAQGYVPMQCGDLLIARDRMGIIRLLEARARR